MIFKILSRGSWLVLLVVAIYLGGQLAESRQEVENLSGRLKIAEQKVAADEETSAADLANAQAQLRALKKALSTKNGEMAQLRKQSALERKQALREAVEKREALTSGFAKMLSRFGLSRTELETLLADLPAEDRLPILEQITVPKAAAPLVVEKPRTNEVEGTPSPDDKAEEKDPSVPEAKPAEAPEQVSADGEAEGEPAAGEPIKKDEPEFVSYTVKRGDNLTQIGRRFDVKVALLMKLNGIADANLLRVGQVLKVPRN